MSNIEFEQQTINATFVGVRPKTGLTGFVIKKGLVKDEKQANYLFLIVVVVCIGIITFTFIRSTSRTSSKISPEGIRQAQQFLPSKS